MIILTQSQNVRVDLRDVREPRVKMVCTVVVSNRWDDIRQSDHNDDAFSSILEFINQNTPAISGQNVVERISQQPLGTRGFFRFHLIISTPLILTYIFRPKGRNEYSSKD